MNFSKTHPKITRINSPQKKSENQQSYYRTQNIDQYIILRLKNDKRDELIN